MFFEIYIFIHILKYFFALSMACMFFMHILINDKIVCIYVRILFLFEFSYTYIIDIIVIACFNVICIVSALVQNKAIDWLYSAYKKDLTIPLVPYCNNVTELIGYIVLRNKDLTIPLVPYYNNVT